MILLNSTQIIQDAIRQSIRTKEQLLDSIDIILAMAKKMTETFVKGGKILFFGNGGSAADAQHLAAELVGRFSKERSPLAAMALTTDTSILTAVANDYSFTSIFARQLEALLKKEDLAVALSTSGNSKNVLEGLITAKKVGAGTIGLTGARGYKIQELTDICLLVPSTETSRIQEAHITVGHILCDLVEQELFPNGPK